MIRTRPPFLSATAKLSAIFGLVFLLFGAFPSLGDHMDEDLIIATVGADHEKELFRKIFPDFEAQYGFRLSWVTNGNQDAYQLAHEGQVDAILTNSPNLEKNLISLNIASNRLSVMKSRMIFVGPKSDPANLSPCRNMGNALKRLYKSRHAMLSISGPGGSDLQELSLWQQTTLGTQRPDGPWLRKSRLDGHKALDLAADLRAYILIDIASWFSYDNKDDLKPICENLQSLNTVYSLLPINRTRGNHEAIAAFSRWFLSDKTQQAIAEFQVNGQAPYRPALISSPLPLTSPY